MSPEERQVIIGRLREEHRQAKEEEALYRAEATKLGEKLQQLGAALIQQPERVLMPGNGPKSVIPSQWHLVDLEFPTIGGLSRLTENIRQAQARREHRASALADAGHPV